MNYTVTAPAARLAAGILELTPAQAAARKHALKPVSGNKYAITAPVEFKQGEVIGYGGDLPKSLAGVLAAVRPQKPAAAAAVNAPQK